MLGLPNIAIMVIDWGSYEILSLWSIFFGVESQTSLVLCWNWMDIMIQAGYGFQIVICSYVGKQIGKGNYQKAREYHRKVFRVGSVFMIGIFLFQLIFREHCLRIFTNNEKVLESAQTYFILIPVLCMLDFIQSTT